MLTQILSKVQVILTYVFKDILLTNALGKLELLVTSGSSYVVTDLYAGAQ